MSDFQNHDGPVVTMAGFMLRLEPRAACPGSVMYLDGERVALLARVPHVQRGAEEQFFRVRVESGREGYAFVPQSLLVGVSWLSLPAESPTEEPNR